MQFKRSGKYILNKLEQELPGYLTYHNAAHTKDVYDAAQWIGKEENISEYEMKLLLTAAGFHDAGYIEGARDHEERSCRLAREVLPGYDYSLKEIGLICGMIMATKIPQSPETHLEEILADADLDYLGRDDFFPISEKLYREFLHFGLLKTEEEWLHIQVGFLESHHYFTHTALSMRKEKKQQHLEQIKAKLK